MPCHTRMKIILLKALLWLYLWGFSFIVATLEPGFLDFDNLPDTNFSCVGKVIGGYYADLETSCQMFHVCTIGQLEEPMDIRFLCLNGTVFDQETRVCERIDEVDCTKSEQFYSLNLELYGNTQPPILEDNPDTEPSDILRHSSTTTTTSTTTRPTKLKTTRPSFIITTTQKPPTTTLEDRFLHFPGSNSADIRFNPEEINISLNPGAPPNIRSKPVSYQQSISDNNKRVIVTTHTTVYKNENRPPPISTQNPQVNIETQKPKTIVNYDLNHDEHLQGPLGGSFNFNLYQTEKNIEYETEIPHHEISFRPSFRPSSRDIEHYTTKPEYKPSTYRSPYHPTTMGPIKIGYGHRGPTTYRNAYSSPLKPALPYYHRTDKPPRIQLPLPLIPTLSPITFSSPAPFSLNRHVESKRYTDHHQPPRIVISASASVSDASGRKVNYSLGTIGDSRFFGQAPHSYDDYKEDDVGLDPFFHDVPKIKRSRQKRAARDEIKSEKEAIDVLKFLFNWYNSHEKIAQAGIPISAETVTEINKALTKTTSGNDEEYYYEDYDYTTKIELKKTDRTNGSIDRIGTEGIIEKVLEAIEKEGSGAKVFGSIDRIGKEGSSEKSYNVSEGVVSVTETPQLPNRLSHSTTEQEQPSLDYEYVDDNYEPETYNHSGANATNQDYDYDYQITASSTTEAYDTVLKILGITTSVPILTPTPEDLTTVHYEGQDLHREYADYQEDVPKSTENATTPDANTMVTPKGGLEGLVTSPDANTVVTPITAETSNAETTENTYRTENENASDTTEYTNTVGSTENPNATGNTEVVTSASTQTSYADYSTSLENISTLTERGITETMSVETATEPWKNFGSRRNYGQDKRGKAKKYRKFSELKKLENGDGYGSTYTTPNFVTTPTSADYTTKIQSVNEYDYGIYSKEYKQYDEIKSYPKTEANPVTEATPIAEELRTEYDTTISTLYTTVQLQTFIDEVESNTNSIADTKGITDTTVAISTQDFQITTAESTTPKLLTTTRMYDSRGSSRRNRFRGTHRFSLATSEKPHRRKPSITEEIVDVIKHRMDSSTDEQNTRKASGRKKIEFNINAYTANLAYRNRNTETTEEIPVTAPSFSKSANPTVAKKPKDFLSTTPLSKSSQNFVFNCFGKAVNKFYSDPRDCRLFHYCTKGFTKTQLLDMKFVCDLGTYFDSEKLICTKDRPSSCT